MAGCYVLALLFQVGKLRPLYSLSHIRRNYGQYGGINLSKYAECLNLSVPNCRHVSYGHFIHSFSHTILQVRASWAQ